MRNSLLQKIVFIYFIFLWPLNMFSNHANAVILRDQFERKSCSVNRMYCSYSSTKYGTKVFKNDVRIWDYPESHRLFFVSNDGKFFVGIKNYFLKEKDRKLTALKVWKSGKYLRSFSVGEVLRDHKFIDTSGYFTWGRPQGFYKGNIKFLVQISEYKFLKPFSTDRHLYQVVLDLETGEIYEIEK